MKALLIIPKIILIILFILYAIIGSVFNLIDKIVFNSLQFLEEKLDLWITE